MTIDAEVQTPANGTQPEVVVPATAQPDPIKADLELIDSVCAAVQANREFHVRVQLAFNRIAERCRQ